jgi:hypothetical protein
MKPLFSPNISGAGRLMRGAIALAFLAAGIFATGLPWPMRAVFFGSAAFTGFEALRGWCALRACGIKTKL